ncbi:MAG: acyl-CoA desaturase, partial [Planctomycetota bacterium]
MEATAAPLGRLWRTLRLWVDSDAPPVQDGTDPDAVQWGRVIPFAALHLACLGVIWVGWSPTAGVVALTTYLVRMFALTAFY